jgi:hypothetical protein
MVKDINVFEQNSKIMEKTVTEQTTKLKKYIKENKRAVAHIKQLESILENEFGYDFDGDEDEFDTEPFTDDGTMLTGEPTTIAEDDYYDDGVNYPEDELVDFVGDTNFDDGMYYDDEETYYESEDEDDEEEDLEEAEEKDDDEDEEKEIKESRKKLKSTLVDFYKEAVRKEPAIKDLKEQIFKSKSLYEATKKVIDFKSKSKSKDMMSIKEGLDIGKKPELQLFRFKR